MLSVLLKGCESISCTQCWSGLCLWCVCVCMCVCVGGYTVGKQSRRDADCVESQQQQLQTPETHCTSLCLSPSSSLLHLFCFSDAAQMDSALIYGKKSPQYSHGDLYLSLIHTHTHTQSMPVPSFHCIPPRSLCVHVL